MLAMRIFPFKGLDTMPHFIIEYSANLDNQLDISNLVRVVHEAAINTSIFPLKGIRTRAERRESYRIADGHPENTFIHLVAHIGHGRSLEVKKTSGQAIFEAVRTYVAPLAERIPLALSFEIHELDPVLNFKVNNLPEWINRRENESEPHDGTDHK